MKTNNYLLTFIFLFPIFLTAQKTSYISIELGVTASENHYADNTFPGYFEDNYPLLNDLTYKKANYNVSVNYERELVSKLYLKLGIEMASHGYKLEEVSGLRWVDEHDGNGGYLLNPDYIHEYTPKINVVSFLVPVGLRYEFTSGKVQPYVEAGIAAGVNGYSTSTSLTETSVNRRYTQNWEQFIAFSNLALGVNYQLDVRTILYLQPHAQLSLKDFQEGDPNELFYSLGIRGGARFTL